MALAIITDLTTEFNRNDWDTKRVIGLKDYATSCQTNELESDGFQKYIKTLATQQKRIALLRQKEVPGQSLADAQQRLNEIIPPSGALYGRIHTPPLVFRQNEQVFILGLTCPRDITASPFFWWQPVLLPELIALANSWSEVPGALSRSDLGYKVGV